MPNVLVTGANRGIGLELTRQLAARGDRVVAVCRHPSSELTSLGVRVCANVDVTRGDDRARLAAELGDTPLDVLVHNAGLLQQEVLGDGQDFDVESVRRQLEVNAVAPLALTAALLPRLGAGAKIAIVTSLMGSLGDNSSGGYYGYRMSKAAVNMAGISLAHDLRERGIAVVLLHPGYVKTEMTGYKGNLTPAESARGLLARLDALTLETSGTFWHVNGKQLPW